MRPSNHTPWLLLAFLGGALGACDGASGSDAGSMMGTDAGPMTDDAGPMMGADAGPMMGTDAGPSEVPIDGWLFDSVTMEVVAGAQVCVLDHPEVDCATSDADGAFLLMADLSGPIALDVTHDDYVSALVHLEVGPEGGNFNGAAILARAFSALFEATGAPEDPTKAHLASGLFLMDGSPAVGATVEITPTSGIGPVYHGAGGPDPSAAAITNGVFSAINMEPGEVTVTYRHPTGSCERRAGTSWPASDPTDLSSTRVVLRAGHISIFAIAFCTP